MAMASLTALLLAMGPLVSVKILAPWVYHSRSSWRMLFGWGYGLLVVDGWRYGSVLDEVLV